MKFYSKTKKLIRVDIEQTTYDNGVIVYQAIFIYDVERVLFNRINVYQEKITDNIIFNSYNEIVDYINNVEKESENKSIKIGNFNEYTCHHVVYPKQMDTLYELYGKSIYVIFYGNNFELVQDHLYSASDKNLSRLIDRLISCKTKSSEVIKSIDIVQIPKDDELDKLKTARKEVIENELMRINQYKQFLESLINK